MLSNSGRIVVVIGMILTYVGDLQDNNSFRYIGLVIGIVGLVVAVVTFRPKPRNRPERNSSKAR